MAEERRQSARKAFFLVLTPWNGYKICCGGSEVVVMLVNVSDVPFFLFIVLKVRCMRLNLG